MTTTVVHWNDREPGSVYIGRPSIFGNPYYLAVIGHRQGAIERYRSYFHTRISLDASFRRSVEALRDKQLVCHCKPMACHGDVIAEYLNGA